MSISPERREFLSAAMLAGLLPLRICNPFLQNSNCDHKFKYMLGSSMYGYSGLEEIVPEVKKTGATAIDLWPKVHGNQREQLDQMGEEKFVRLLEKHGIQLGCITQYKLGPFGLRDEMRLLNKLGGSTLVTGAVGPRGLKGSELKKAVASFVEKMKPHLEVAEATGVTIAIENHANSLIESAESMRYLAELRTSEKLAIAFAPYHLPQEADSMSKLIRNLGNSIEVFYAWQHGMGCMKKLPKKEELLQMPGRGSLDFKPLKDALAEINFRGWVEIFMHPFPRGIPILETTAEVTEEINRARDYLEKL
ncbi:MAG: TIM barrel protein [Planctomycetaceae bacterium]|nr:TIM barrel protein [Planctomycetaceae bacterium]